MIKKSKIAISYSLEDNYNLSHLMSQTQCPYQGGGQSGGTKQNKPINNIFFKNPFFFTLLHSLMNLWYHNTASAHWEQSYMFTSVTSQGNDHAVTGKWNWFWHQAHAGPED